MLRTAGDHFDTIDDCLGPRAGRFFGDGFRGVTHQITDVTVRPGAADGGQVVAKTSINYPSGWSTKQADAHLRPHVSGIDSLVISVQLAEMYLTDTYNLDRPKRRRMWLRQFTMKAPSAPQEDLADVGVRAVNTGHRAEPNSLCGHVSTFSCEVGSLKATCEIEHEVPEPAAAPQLHSLRSADDILGAAAMRYYGDGYKRRQHSITDIDVGRGNQYIQGLVRVAPVGMAGLADDGLGAHYGPSLSMVDCFLSLAQFAQVLVYRLDGIDRSRSNTLWLRTVRMDCQTPYQPMLNSFTAALALTRSRTIPMGGRVWHTFGVSGHFQGIRAEATFAHQLPTQRPAGPSDRAAGAADFAPEPRSA
jgi:hypothetical protein